MVSDPISLIQSLSTYPLPKGKGNIESLIDDSIYIDLFDHYYQYSIDSLSLLSILPLPFGKG